MTTISRALLSVSDKTGLAAFASALHRLGVELISTGGTYSFLQREGIPVTPVSSVTQFPEILDGRVKTLHPNIHGGLLARRDVPAHLDQLAAHGIGRIDLVAINLYPFEKTIESSDVTLEEAIEQIDIGGPSMLRSAAKNYASVTAICDPSDYGRVIEAMERLKGAVSDELRFQLALKVFRTTSRYDAAISRYLNTRLQQPDALPSVHTLGGKKTLDLRYGENPHQSAALYGDFDRYFHKLHGKELSFNNLVDIQAAAELVAEFESPAVAIIKHTNPCGCAVGESLVDAYLKALSTDPVSAFGGIVAVNRELTQELAGELNKIFLEVVVAPSFHEEALGLLKTKKDRRLLLQRLPLPRNSVDMKVVAGGFLLQEKDEIKEDPSTWKVVTRRRPTEQERRALAFAWKIAKHVKSNAIIYTNESQTLGVGAGQMSRVDSSTIAVLKARAAGHSLEGSVVASDAFFPFADGLLEAVKAGATAVVQPGGSVRDAEVIQAADEHGVAMMFTGIRHFKH